MIGAFKRLYRRLIRQAAISQPDASPAQQRMSARRVVVRKMQDANQAQAKIDYLKRTGDMKDTDK